MTAENTLPVAVGGNSTEAEAIAALASPDVIVRSVADWLGDGLPPEVPTDLVVAVTRDNEGDPVVNVADLDQYRESPRLKAGAVVVSRVQSLVDVCARHYVANVSTVYVDPLARRVGVVFDDHGVEAPGWRQHRASYVPVVTPEFQAWTGIDNAPIGQEDLAEHLAAWQHTIAEPDAADVYEIAQSFQATVSAKFEQGARLATGARQLVYTEDIAARSGSLEIPESLTLSVRLFDDPFAPVQPLKSALRFRIRDGELKFRVVLEPLAPVYLAYFEGVADALKAQGFDVVYGAVS